MSTAPGICLWAMASLMMGSRTARRESSGAWEKAAAENRKAKNSRFFSECFTSAVTLHNPERRLKGERYQRCSPSNSPFACTRRVCYNPISAQNHLSLTLPNRESGFSFLVRNFVAQDDRFRDAFGIMEGAIAARAFPACSLAITLHGELVAHKAFGRFTYDPASPQVTTASLFDLASLTKVVATTAMAMILYERGLLDLGAPVAAIGPEFAQDDARPREVTLRMLLAHSS